jgi:hypothetical protein
MMATLEETQKQLAAAKTRVAQITEQLKTPVSSAVRASLKAQLTAANKEVKRIEKLIGPLEQAQREAERQGRAAVVAGELTAEKVKLGVKTRTDAAVSSQRAYEKDPTNDDKWAKYQKDLQNLFEYEQQAVSAGSSITPTVTLQQGTYSFGKPETVATATTAAPVTVSMQNIPGPSVRVGTGTRAPTPTVTPKAEEETVTEPSVTESGGTTLVTTVKGAGKRGGKKAVAAKGIGPMNLPQDVRDEFKALFPQYAASLDGGEREQQFVDFFGADLIAIWAKQLNKDTAYDLTDPTEKAAFERDVENTAYGQRTTQAQQNFDFNPQNQAVAIRAKRDEITKSYADLQLTDAQLNEVARDAARNGYTGDDLRFSLYNYAYRGALPTATESALADEIRNIGRSYGYTVSQDKLKAALTGTPFNGRMVTKESLLQEAQTAAKGAYGHLADQIDSGLTLDDIFYNYKMFAARTLGVDPNTIDYTKDTKWSEAFGTKETGQMSLNDWVTKLKRDGRYGYQYSPQAQEEVASVVSTLEKAFGFRK